jgi:hypothetical protein
LVFPLFQVSLTLSESRTHIRSPNAGRDTPSVHQLGGLTCYLLGMPTKYRYASEAYHRLSVGREDSSALYMSVLPGRTTVGITYPLFYKNRPGTIQNPWGTVCCDVSSKSFRHWLSWDH